ncbi:MAG: flippase-like domain-containing protein [Actinobacteria bacterium]|nr:MAG: flippase-like domain-containing protein [Actinomycetota bacterium]
MSAVLHDIRVFFDHLADVGWTALGIALLCQLTKLCCTSRAWRNILATSYAEETVRWRSIFGAYLARVGVNAIVPARGGDAVGLFIAKRRIEGATYPTLGATLVALTLFDSVLASCFILYALASGELPGSSVLAHLHAFDFHWFFAHLQGTLIAIGLILLALLLLLLWFAEHLIGFWKHVSLGFSVFADKTHYLRHVAVWQVADWSLRLVAIFFFLRAFHVPATLHNAILVQVTQSLAVLFPISPSGIGTEQALLLYSFAGKAAKSVLLSFSVGMRVTLIIFNALLGFGAILLMMRTLHWRQHVEADRDAVAEHSR